MKRHVNSGVARLFTVLAFLVTTLFVAPQSYAATARFYNDRVSGSVLPYGGMAPILDIEVSSDGSRDEIVSGFEFTTVDGESETPIGVDIYVYENTVPGSLGRFVGKSNFRAGVRLVIDAYLDFYQGLRDTRHLTVYAKSRDLANSGVTFAIRPLRVNGNGDLQIVQIDRSMWLTLYSSVKLGVVRWKSDDGNIVASAQHQNQLLGTFDITVENEQVVFSDMPVRIEYYGHVEGISQITLQDGLGNRLAGPVDLEDDGTGRGGYCFFSNLKLNRGSQTIQVRGTPGKSGYNASVMCSIDARPDAEQVVSLKGYTYSYWLTPEAPSLYMQSTKIATPTFRYEVHGAQSTVVSPGKRVLLGYIILNKDADSDTRFEGIIYKSVRLKFDRSIKGLLENMALRFDWSLNNATADMNFVSDSEVQLNFINQVVTGRDVQNVRLLIEADVADIAEAKEFTMYVEDQTFVAVGADYGVRANAQSVDSTSITFKIGPPDNRQTGGHIQWVKRVAWNVPGSGPHDYYELDVATLEAGQYSIQMAYGIDQPWTNIVTYIGKPESVAKVTTPVIVQKPEIYFRVVRVP
jgi:hypothetical protein